MSGMPKTKFQLVVVGVATAAVLAGVTVAGLSGVFGPDPALEQAQAAAKAAAREEVAARREVDEARAALRKDIEDNSEVEAVGLVEDDFGSARCTIYKVKTTDGQVVLVTTGSNCQLARVEPARS